MRPRYALLVLALSATLLAGCRPDAVRVAFEPTVGDTFVYAITVDAVSDLVVEGREPQHREDRIELIATHTVLAAEAGAIRVRVRLADVEGAVGARDFLVRYDRGGQLVGIDEVETLPSDLLGDIGLGEIFPAAAAAPPSGPLKPGDTWAILAPLNLSGASESRLSGTGRLDRLGVEDGHRVATIATETSLSVTRTRSQAASTTTLAGTQSTSAAVTHDLSNGAVTRATSATNGRFDLLISPNASAATPEIVGELRVLIRSTTSRVV
ncbi:MAG: hypothetical protein ACR2H3_16240 [Acidimicrobiales bacterium]